METSGGKEAAMWKMAKRLFSEYPYSDGKDKRYEEVKKALRSKYGKNAICKANKPILKKLALDTRRQLLYAYAEEVFSVPPFSNGQDSHYAALKKVIRGKFGKKSVGKTEKQMLKQLALQWRLDAWKYASMEFRKPPFSNGKDKRYEQVKSELRKRFGKENITELKGKLKKCARSKGALPPDLMEYLFPNEKKTLTSGSTNKSSASQTSQPSSTPSNPTSPEKKVDLPSAGKALLKKALTLEDYQKQTKEKAKTTGLLASLQNHSLKLRKTKTKIMPFVPLKRRLYIVPPKESVMTTIRRIRNGVGSYRTRRKTVAGEEVQSKPLFKFKIKAKVKRIGDNVDSSEDEDSDSDEDGLFDSSDEDE